MELKENGETETITSNASARWRNTKQEIMPATVGATDRGGLNIYPSHPLDEGIIYMGNEPLAQWIIEQKTVVIDGYVGVFWNRIVKALTLEFEKRGTKVNWHHMDNFLKPEATTEQLVQPFLGAAD